MCAHCGHDLPFSLQEKYSADAVDVLVVNNGKLDTLQVPVRSLSSAQAAQVFTRSGVRDIGAQRAFLSERSTRAFFPTLDSKRPYTISGQTVCFKENCKLTHRQMLRTWPGQKVAVKKKSMERALALLDAGHTPLRSGLLPNGDIWTMVYTRDI